MTVHLKVSESQSKQIFDFTELKKTYSSFCWFMSTKLHHCWSKVTLESTNSTSKIDAVAHDLLKRLQKYQWARLLEANRQGSTNRTNKIDAVAHKLNNLCITKFWNNLGLDNISKE